MFTSQLLIRTQSTKSKQPEIKKISNNFHDASVGAFKQNIKLELHQFCLNGRP